MKITTIRYEQLHSFGQYNNEKFCVEAITGVGDCVADKITLLREIVEGEIARANTSRANAVELRNKQAREEEEERKRAREEARLASPYQCPACHRKILITIDYHHYHTCMGCGRLLSCRILEDDTWSIELVGKDPDLFDEEEPEDEPCEPEP